MRQVFYIDADEEMISVIGRIRKSSAVENFIVAPYRALILQSIVNLRLLNHDARKNGKEIIVVTQDDQSRSLCEKAGIRTQAVLDEEYAHANTMQQSGVGTSPLLSSETAIEQQMLQQETNRDVSSQERFSGGVYLPFSDALGTTDFFGNTAAIPSPQTVHQNTPKQQSIESLSKPLPYSDVKRVLVHDKNPKKLTALNSHRFEEEKLLGQQKSFTPPSLRGAQTTQSLLATPFIQTRDNSQNFGADSGSHQTNESHLSKFFDHRAKTELKIPMLMAPKVPEKQVLVSGSKKMRAFFLFFGFVSVLSVIGVGAYLFLPKANVHVKLKVMTQKSDFDFDGSTKAVVYSAESKVIPVRIIEKDQEITRSFDATGKVSLADQKARGSVIVYNEYSAEKQLLVASTRLLSQDGKVFRLLSSVTVPGMTTVSGSVNPGVIEATVTADQPGQEYNVAPTSFTIPGFEGSAKHAKFYAKSSKAMSGGGTSGSDVSAVSDQDVAQAKKSIELESKNVAASVMNQAINPGEKILNEVVETSILSESASPQSGAVTNAFDYRVKVHIRAFVFSEDDLKKMVLTLFSQQNTEKIAELSLDAVDLQYDEPTEDFTAETLRISVHAVARSEFNVDETQLQADILGRNEGDIADLLQKYPQIDSISVELWPEFLTNRVPMRKDRVTLTAESL